MTRKYAKFFVECVITILLLVAGCGSQEAAKKTGINYDFLEALEAEAREDVYIAERPDYSYQQGGRQIQSDDLSVLQPDGYGMGVHINRYGQPVKLRPDFGGVPGEQLQITTDGYGMGVHVDQYGRPVREYSCP